MTCMKAQGWITDFIDDKLTLSELEAFIEHIDGCKECREELEVYYALLTAMRQLDEDKNLPDDFSKELSDKLESSKEKIIHAKYIFYRKKGVLFFAIFILTLLYSMQHYFMKEEKRNTVTESHFRMKVSFGERRYDSLAKEIDKALKKN